MLVSVKMAVVVLRSHRGVRVPFNLGGLEAALISKLLELKVQKFRNQIGLEVENTEAGGGEKKILPCTSLEGVQKIGQHHPLWAGQCFDFKGTSPRMAGKNLPASPPLEGAMLAESNTNVIQ